MANVRDLFLNLIENKRGDALRSAADDLDRLATRADATSGRFRRLTEDTHGLSRSIEESRTRIRGLYADFAQNRDKSIFGDIRREEADLRRLERTAKALGGGDDKKRGAQGLMRLVPGNWFGGGVGGFDFSSFAAEARSALILGLIGAAIAVAPMLGGIVGGAVTGAIGAGAMAGGIAAAAHDPLVAAAADQLTDVVREGWGRAGELFVGPTTEALHIFRDALRDIDIGSVFAPAAEYVVPFAQGIAALARNFMPGFNAALENAGPFIEVMRQELGELGSALGDLFKDLSESQGALDGLRTMFDILDATLTAFGATMEWLGDRYHEWIVAMAELTGALEDVAWYFSPQAGNAIAGMNDHLENFLKANEYAALSADKFSTSMDGAARATWRQNQALSDAIENYRELFGIAMTLDEAILRNTKGWIDLQKAFKENGRVWDMSEKGIANQEAVLSQLQKIQDEYEAMLAAPNADPAKATAWLDAQIRKLYDMAKAAGATKAELDKINGYRLTIDVATVSPGLLAPGGNQHHSKGSTYHGFAAGGVTPVGSPYWVGEQGRELRFDTAPGYVMPHGASMAYMAGRASAASAMTAPSAVVLQVQPGSGGEFESFLIEAIRRFVRVAGGGSSQSAFASAF